MLTNIYENSRVQTKMYYDKILYLLKTLEDDAIANCINTFGIVIDNLASMGTSISVNDSAIALLGSLPKFYKGLVVFISGQSNLTV
jgi:hypothetical protein